MDPAEGGGTGDRRHHDDRRTHGEADGPGGRRGRSPKAPPSPLANVLRSLGLVVMLVIVIVGTVRLMRPVYATRGTLGDELRKHAPGAAKAIGAGDSTDVDQFMATAKYQEEKRNFYEDVMRLKQVDSARADSIAQYAVREAYKRGISPAIIFGVMLTENSKFVSKAKSNVGAVGLMQVYPKVWLNKEMTALFGKDLASDSTNVKYGVFILSHYFNPKTKSGAAQPRDWQTALLRYNGCVKGTNTPRCHTYPDKVQSFVENQATSICNGRSFYDCIAKPFIAGLFGNEDAAAANAAPPAPAPAPVVPQAAPAAVPVTPPAATKATGASAKSTATKAASKTSAAKRSTAKKRTAKKRTAKASTAKKSTAKASATRKPAAKKTSTARKPTAKPKSRSRTLAPLKAPKPIEVKVP